MTSMPRVIKQSTGFVVVGNEDGAAPLVMPPEFHCTEAQWQVLRARSKGTIDLTEVLRKIRKNIHE